MKVEFDGERETVTVNGVEISLSLLAAFSDPDPSMLYRIVKLGNVVTVRVIPVGLATAGHA